MKFKAIIFDMDGVLIDSMLYWVRNDTDFLKKYNLELTKELVTEFSGKGLGEVAKLVKDRFNLPQSVEQIMADNRGHSEDIYDTKTLPMPGADMLLEKIKQSNLKSAIASGSPLYRIEKITDRFNWKDYFHHLVSVDHVDDRGKPDPSVYRHTAKLLKIHPSECVVVEDAQNGVEAALSAGMKCVAIPDARWSYGDFSKADLIADSLVDPKLLTFLGL